MTSRKKVFHTINKCHQIPGKSHLNFQQAIQIGDAYLYKHLGEAETDRRTYGRTEKDRHKERER